VNRLVFGCGYLGSRVARSWLSDGDNVYAVTRCPDNARRMKQEGMIPVIADITEADSVKELPHADTILFSVGMDRKKYDSVHSVYVDGLKNVLSGISTARQEKAVKLALPLKNFFKAVGSRPNLPSSGLPEFTALNAFPQKR
jgi:nucleoside-diphosphate-sugar epimerase